MRIAAASRRAPPGAAFSGFTAAWLHGHDVPWDPVEISVGAGTCVSTRAGMIVRRRAMKARDVVKARGFRATSAAGTVRDLCGRLSLSEAVVVADMALHAGLLETADLRDEAVTAAGLAGAPMLRRVLEYVEPASESPMETRLRMLLVLAGLPPPEAQVAIRDRFHRFLGRPDLYYRDQRLGLEYDGATPSRLPRRGQPASEPAGRRGHPPAALHRRGHLQHAGRGRQPGADRAGGHLSSLRLHTNSQNNAPEHPCLYAKRRNGGRSATWSSRSAGPRRSSPGPRCALRSAGGCRTGG